MSQEERRKITTIAIYPEDLKILNRLKRDKPNRKKYERRLELMPDLVSRAVAALVEKERNSP